MKIGHVLGLVVVGYLAIVGINEFLWRHATPRVGALEAGIDWTATRRLAALGRPTYFEIAEVLPRVMKEWEITQIPDIVRLGLRAETGFLFRPAPFLSKLILFLTAFTSRGLAGHLLADDLLAGVIVRAVLRRYQACP